LFEYNQKIPLQSCNGIFFRYFLVFEGGGGTILDVLFAIVVAGGTVFPLFAASAL